MSIYDLVAKQWRRVYPVDAKEMVVERTVMVQNPENPDDPDDKIEKVITPTGSFEGPPIEIIGAGGKQVIHVSDLNRKLSEGFQLANPKDPALRGLASSKVERIRPEVAKLAKGDMPGETGGGSGGEVPGDTGSGENPTGDEPYKFSKHTVDELRDFASGAGLSFPSNAGKAKLIEILDKSDFRPS